MNREVVAVKDVVVVEDAEKEMEEEVLDAEGEEEVLDGTSYNLLYNIHAFMDECLHSLVFHPCCFISHF